MKYRKKPVVIDAVIWNGKNQEFVMDFCKDAYMENTCNNGVQMIIKTLEGQHMATVGDYIIKGIKGEFYPCKPDIFEQTYEKAGE